MLHSSDFGVRGPLVTGAFQPSQTDEIGFYREVLVQLLSERDHNRRRCLFKSTELHTLGK